MARSLYICYFGVREPLVQTQVIPYLRELVKGGHEMTLLTFEPHKAGGNEADESDKIRSELAAAGIEWHWLRYHKSPSVPATLFDLMNGVRIVRRLSRPKPFDIYHVRGHVPAPIGAVAKRIWGGKLLFDIRGFLPEEYVDAGVWNENGIVYKTFKRVEKWAMRKSDGFIVLTKAARDILFPEVAETGTDRLGRPVEVIPCCLDFSRVNVRLEDRDHIRKELGWSDRFVITHVGSLGGLYLTDEIVGLMKAAKRQDPKTFALILTQRDAKTAAEKLEAVGFDRDSYLVKSVDSGDIMSYLVAADASISIVKRSYSAASRSPTKIAEYLAAGLPLISSFGVGDTDRLIANENVGVGLSGFTDEDFNSALGSVTELLKHPDIRKRLAAVAKEYFDLESVGGPRYRRMYERLMNPTTATSLYICYFGVREPLVQTQVIPYLRELAKAGHKITLLTFEPDVPDSWEADIRHDLGDDSIKWNWLRYHKRPSVPVTIFDIVNGVRFVRQLRRSAPFDIYHVRGHIPAPVGAIAKRFWGGKLLFDIRGFMPEEYVDAGMWPKGGALYRSVKRIEKWLMSEADGFVVLTEKARSILFPESAAVGVDGSGRPVEVIPCCVDSARFAKANDDCRAEIRRAIGADGRRIITYVGSFGGWYLTEEMLDFLAVARARDPAVFVMILTQRRKSKASEKLRARGFADGDFFVGSVKPDEIPRYLSAADMAISFIKACYSKQSSSPTKIAEYLACGIPIIANRGVGDLDALIERAGIGAMIDDYSKEAYLKALEAVENLGNVGDLCRKTAKTEFDLEAVGGKRYKRIYQDLLR